MDSIAGKGEDPSAEERVSPLPGARTALVLLLAINLFNYIDRYVLAAVVPYIRQAFFGPGSAVESASVTGRFLDWFQQAFGFTPANALIGMLSMAFMVTYMIAAPVFGRLAERRSRWALIGIGVVLWSLASGASGWATSFGALLLTRCFVGIGEAAYGPVAPAVISDLYPIKIRGRVLSWFYMAIPVGSALGFVLGEQVAKAYGWRWAFYAVVLPGIALGLWAFFMKEPKRGQADLPTPAVPATASKIRWADYLVLARTPSYVLNTLGMTAMTFAMGGIGFWMADYVAEYRKVPGSTTTIFGGIMVVAGLFGTLLGGMAGDRLRRRFPGSYFLVSGIAILTGFPLFVAVLYTPFPLAWVFIFLAVFCLFFNTGPTNTILANVTHPAMRATAFALNIFVIHALGDVVSPLIIGLIADKYNMNAAFLVVGFMFLVSSGCWLSGVRHLARDTELAPTRLAR